MSGKSPPTNLMRSLCWAEHHMTEARDGCDHLLSLSAIDPHLEHCIGSGIVICYARPFTANNGISCLPAKFRQFRNTGMQDVHNAVMEARDMIYAHLDMRKEPKHLPYRLSMAERNAVSIQIRPNGECKWTVPRHALSRSMLKPIMDLCEFQSARLHEDSSKMFAHLCTGKIFKPGNYTLGVGFP